MRNVFAPLSSSFMLASMLGFLFSAVWIIPRNLQWGVAFCVVFAVMFISAVVSMTHAPAEDM